MTMTADTTATETRETGKGTVQPAELIAALTAVIPHAGTDKTLPMLRALKFETTDDNKTLTVVATNRYTLGTYRMEWDGGEVDALLDLDDVKTLLAYAKKAAKYNRIALTFTDKTAEAFDFERRVEFRLMECDFVKWAAILPSASQDHADRIDRIGFNPAFMASFAKAAERGLPMILTMPGRPDKPVRIDIGENFTGLIMPVRLT